jgi:hypothetical protein
MIKQIALIFLLCPFLSKGQSWIYSKGGSSFDGTYKTSLVEGKGNEYPYKTPNLVINKFDNDNSINFYLKGAGFFQDNTGLNIKWVFDNEPKTIYSSYSWSLSNDGKTIFFSSFNNPNKKSTKLEAIEIIDKLTRANKVELRVMDNYGTNDIVFSLKGSSKAINFVLPLNERNKLLKIASAKRDNEILEKKDREVLFESISQKLKEEMFTEYSIMKLKKEIKDDLVWQKNIIDIEVIGKGYQFEKYREVDVFYINKDGSKSEIYGDWTVLDSAPVYKRNLESKTAVNSLLLKYKNEKLIKHIADEILKKYNKDGFPINSIKDVKIVLNRYFQEQFWSCKISIYLNDKSVVTIAETYLYSKVSGNGGIKITKKDLLSMGGEENVEF